MVEGLNKELRRRTRIIAALASEESLLGLASAITMEMGTFGALIPSCITRYVIASSVRRK
jgi:hypothetical protein